jgi:WD40 repeat protein
MGYVCGMAVSGRRLIRSSKDGTVRVWSTETWECVQTVVAYPAASGKYVRRLGVCGPTLVGGTHFGVPLETRRDGEVLVWDLETLQPLHTLALPRVIDEEEEDVEYDPDVRGLVCCGREVWAAVGERVVAWGRRG